MADTDRRLTPGQRLLVPFGRLNKVGYYLGPCRPPKGLKTRPVIDVLDDLSLFRKDLFELCVWMADYYFANPADCLSAALPGAVRSRHRPGLVWNRADADIIPESVRQVVKPGSRLSPVTVRKIKSVAPDLLTKMLRTSVLAEVWSDGDSPQIGRVSAYTLNRSAYSAEFFGRGSVGEPFDGQVSRSTLQQLGWSDHFIRKACRTGLLISVRIDDERGILDFVKPRSNVTELAMTKQQQDVYDTVVDQLQAGFGVSLLHGVTGSGKTLVYCKLAQQVLKNNQTVLILTPEIALSGTTLAYFRGFFGDKVTVIHSAMTARERLESWSGIRNGKYRIVVGPRSAVFAPLENPGLIVVDEEHDSSYKQDDPAPRFHGRDAAIMRGKINDIPVLLGSATPSVESYHNAIAGRYRLLELVGRPGKATLPTVRTIDMRSQRVGGDLPYMSLPMKKAISQRMENGEQVILYLNRRGYSPYVKCEDCGYVPGCPNCNVKLTYHRSGLKLSCHYCGHVEFAGDTCRKCGSSSFAYMGAGTQKVEESLPRLFDQVRPVRLDSDTASGRRKAYRIVEKFAGREFNMLLGTQMVTKGLDLPGVTLVGVLAADSELDMPDFRSSERTFAKLVQVAGRSGRVDDKGEVLIQTFYPDLSFIASAAAQDYQAFYGEEIKSRKEYDYPPFVRLVNFVMSGKELSVLERASSDFRYRLEERAHTAGLKLQLLGPASCPLSYLKGKRRRHMLVKTSSIQSLVRLLTSWEEQEARFGLPASIKITVDVDPVDMM